MITRQLATDLYGNATDRLGNPIIEHAFRVAAIVNDSGAPEHVVDAALLHDLLEDTDVTADDLLRIGIAPQTVDLVVALTRRPNEIYADYVTRVAANAESRLIKLADNTDNYLRLHQLPIQDGASLRRRYNRARDILLQSHR